MAVLQPDIDVPPSLQILWPEIAPDEQGNLDHETAIIAEQKAKVFRLYCQKKSVRTVAEYLAAEGKSQGVAPVHFTTVGRYVREVLENFRLVTLQTAAQNAAAMLAKLSWQETELIEAWERSKGETEEKTTGRRVTSAGQFDSASVKKKQRLGEAVYQKLLLDVWDRQAKLLGLMKTEDFKGMNGLPPVKYVAGLDPVEAV